MSTTRNAACTSAPRHQLVELISSIGFGRIENLPVRDGEPVLIPPPRVVRERLLGARERAPDCRRDTHELKGQVRELFAELEQLGDGIVTCLEIRHGLPFKLTIADPPMCEGVRT